MRSIREECETGLGLDCPGCDCSCHRLPPFYFITKGEIVDWHATRGVQALPLWG